LVVVEVAAPEILMVLMAAAEVVLVALYMFLDMLLQQELMQ
jgi:hypothetical protein